MSVIEVPAPTVLGREVTAADVLHRAADLLEEFGWCQGRWGSKEEGEMCAYGAIIDASVELEGPMPRMSTALMVWNDEPGRTRQEVVAHLREMAEAA